MMKGIHILLIICCCFITACKSSGESKQESSDTASKAPIVEMLANNDLRFIELTGTPYERGLTHGKLLRKEIQELIRLFKEDIAETTKEEPEQFIAKFLEKTDYKTSVLKWMPELMDELKGISEGSGVDLETIFMHQLGDEYWFNTKDILAHSCSSFAVNKTATQPSMTAQNMDIPQYFHGFQTVMKINDPVSDKVMMFLTIPGHLGITGMNSKAVSINCNTLMQLDYGKSGLPVTFIVRGVVGKDTQEEALKFVNEIQHASGQNYMIGGPEKVYSLECSKNKVVEFRPFVGSDFTYHTNHPMSNDDYSITYLEKLKTKNKTIEEGLYECQRINSFRERFTNETNMVGIKEIKEVLRSRDHEGADVVSNDYTYASVIYELSKTPKFIIAPGKPHEKEFIELLFR